MNEDEEYFALFDLFRSHPSISTDTYNSVGRNIDIIFTSEIIKELMTRDASNNVNATTDISRLKKMIKHSKNPLERKALEKQLNALYKERKHGVKK